MAAAASGRQLFASGSWDKNVRIYDATADAFTLLTVCGHTCCGQCICGRSGSGFFEHDEKCPVTSHHADVNSVAWGPNGELASASANKASVWDPTTGTELAYVEHERGGVVQSVAWSPHGELATASSFDDKSVKIWKVQSGEGRTTHQLFEFKPFDSFFSVAWSSNGALAAGSHGSLFVWARPTAKRCLHGVIETPQDSLNAIAGILNHFQLNLPVSDESPAAMVAYEVFDAGLSAVNGLYRRDLSSASPVFKHTQANFWIRRSSDRRRWVLVPAAGSNCHTCIYKADGHAEEVPSGGWACARDYSEALAERDGWDGFQRVREPPPSVRQVLERGEAAAPSIADMIQIDDAGNEEDISEFLESLRLTASEFEGLKVDAMVQHLRGLCSTSPETSLVQAFRQQVSLADKTAVAYELSHRSSPQGLDVTGHGNIQCVAFSLDGALLASGCANWPGDVGKFAAQIWDMSEARPSQKGLVLHDGPVTSLAFSPAASVLASASGSSHHAQGLQLWDVATCVLRCELIKAKYPGSYTAEEDRIPRVAQVNSLAFTPDGAILASGMGCGKSTEWGCAVILWDVAAGTETRTILGYGARVSSVAFSGARARGRSSARIDADRLAQILADCNLAEHLEAAQRWLAGKGVRGVGELTPADSTALVESLQLKPVKGKKLLKMITSSDH